MYINTCLYFAVIYAQIGVNFLNSVETPSDMPSLCKPSKELSNFDIFGPSSNGTLAASVNIVPVHSNVDNVDVGTCDRDCHCRTSSGLYLNIESLKTNPSNSNYTPQFLNISGGGQDYYSYQPCGYFSDPSYCVSCRCIRFCKNVTVCWTLYHDEHNVYDLDIGNTVAYPEYKILYDTVRKNFTLIYTGSRAYGIWGYSYVYVTCNSTTDGIFRPLGETSHGSQIYTFDYQTRHACGDMEYHPKLQWTMWMSIITILGGVFIIAIIGVSIAVYRKRRSTARTEGTQLTQSTDAGVSLCGSCLNHGSNESANVTSNPTPAFDQDYSPLLV